MTILVSRDVSDLCSKAMRQDVIICCGAYLRITFNHSFFGSITMFEFLIKTIVVAVVTEVAAKIIEVIEE